MSLSVFTNDELTKGSFPNANVVAYFSARVAEAQKQHRYTSLVRLTASNPLGFSVVLVIL